MSNKNSIPFSFTVVMGATILGFQIHSLAEIMQRKKKEKAK